MNKDLRELELFRNIPKRGFQIIALLLILATVLVENFKDNRNGKELVSKISTQEEKLALHAEKNMQMENELEALKEVLLDEKSKRENFEDKLDDIDDTVDDLDKLSKTDEELLMKYSKVYFLNEHFVPIELETIPSEYLVNGTSQKIHADVWPFLEDLLKDAKEDGVDIRVVSAFRDFYTQSGLKNQYKITYGAGTANQFSADQGYSEHQLGTTVDFGSPLNGIQSFDSTAQFTWLTENAQKYGFTLSYPKNNSYYVYEPWHWRFVGRSLAKKLERDEIYFYDMDQREINEYLTKIFD